MTKLTQNEQQFLSESIRIIPNFPKEGIIFRDITTLLNNQKALSFLLDHLSKRYQTMNLDFIAGTESRGFIFAAMICAKLNYLLFLYANPINFHQIPILASMNLSMGQIE